jgi:uncharacterized protein (TIGR02757 family)
MDLKEELDHFAELYNRPNFIKDDPISVPHQYEKRQDIEIAGIIAATLAWGQRKTIIRSALRFLEPMGKSPHEFVLNHNEEDRIPFLEFKHRTFQPPDALAFLEFFQRFYRQYDTMEDAFARHITTYDPTVEKSIIGFHQAFMQLSSAPDRTRKHIASPERKSTCKRLNMYLRWMVRRDDKGVDFGLWKKINPSQLCIPLDVHVERIARRLNLIDRKQRDWKTTLELTEKLRELDPLDPVRYDFALFGMSIAEKDLIR